VLHGQHCQPHRLAEHTLLVALRDIDRLVNSRDVKQVPGLCFAQGEQLLLVVGQPADHGEFLTLGEPVGADRLAGRPVLMADLPMDGVIDLVDFGVAAHCLLGELLREGLPHRRGESGCRFAVGLILGSEVRQGQGRQLGHLHQEGRR